MLKRIEATSHEFHKRYGINLLDMQQGSDAWHQSRLGVITASNAWKVVSKGRGNAPSETRRTYMMSLVAEIATGVWEDIKSPILQWGKDNEDGARSSYELLTNNEVTEVAFVFKNDTFRCGVSLDGIANGNIPAEYKCPWNTVHYLNFLLEEKIKKEYFYQCQFGMWVTGGSQYHMGQYDPRMKKSPFHMAAVPICPEAQAEFDAEVPKFIKEMDEILEKLGFKFGEQWERLNV